MTFQNWIEDLIAKRFGTATALANAVGLQLTPFTRGAATGTFNLMNLLKLAQVTEEPPSRVLRLAGKADAADLIEQLYGPGRDALTASQRAVVEAWDRITDPAQRSALLYTMRKLAGERDPSDVVPSEARATRAAKARATRKGRAGRPGSKE